MEDGAAVHVASFPGLLTPRFVACRINTGEGTASNKHWGEKAWEKATVHAPKKMLL